MGKFLGICTDCGTQDEYRTEMKGNNLTAWCNHCDKFIGNKPYDEPKLYFGKFKGKPIADFETPDEINYLQWIKNKFEGYEKLTEGVKEAIDKKV